MHESLRVVIHAQSSDFSPKRHILQTATARILKFVSFTRALRIINSVYVEIDVFACLLSEFEKENPVMTLLLCLMYK